MSGLPPAASAAPVGLAGADIALNLVAGAPAVEGVVAQNLLPGTPIPEPDASYLGPAPVQNWLAPDPSSRSIQSAAPQVRAGSLSSQPLSAAATFPSFPALTKSSTWNSIKTLTKPVTDWWSRISPVTHAVCLLCELTWFFYQVVSAPTQNASIAQAVMDKINQSPIGKWNFSDIATKEELYKALDEGFDNAGATRDEKRDLEITQWKKIHSFAQSCLENLNDEIVNRNCEDVLKQFVNHQPSIRSEKPPLTQADQKPFSSTTFIAESSGLSTSQRISMGANSNGITDWQISSIVVACFGPILVLALLGLLSFIFLPSFMRRRRMALAALKFKEKQDDNDHTQGFTGVSIATSSATLTSQPMVQVQNKTDLRHRKTAKPVRTIWMAASEGSIDEVQQFISSGTYIDTVDQIQGTALSAAAKAGQRRMVDFLIKQGASTHITGGVHGSAIQAAAASGDLRIVQLLLDSGASVDTHAGVENTPLIIAIRNRSEDIANFLIDQGATVMAEAGNYGSPLQAAVYFDLPTTVVRLLQEATEVDCTVGEYGTALQIATTANNVKLAGLLLKHGAQVDLRTRSYGPPLQLACYCGFEEMGTLILHHGAEPNQVDDQGRFPVHVAASMGRTKLVAELVKHGAEVDRQDADFCTALHHAAVSGHTGVVRVLLENNADPAIADKFSAHPLFRAVTLGHKAIAKMLIEAGTPVNFPDVYGYSPVHNPQEGSDVDILKWLLEKGGDVNLRGSNGKTPVHRAADAGKIHTLELLLTRPEVRTDIQDNDQATPLHYAIVHGRADIANEYAELLKRGEVDSAAFGDGSKSFDAYVDELTANYERCAIRLLAQPDCDVNGRGGATFQEAIIRGNAKLIALILQKPQLTLNLQGGPYGSAAGAAAICGNTDVLKMLVERGANLNIVGGEFGTPLQAAAAKGHAEIVRLLLEHGAKPMMLGGRYGSPYNAALAMQRLADPADEERRRDSELICSLLSDAGAVETPADAHRDERWKLTPGGWCWIPKGRF